MKDKFGKTYGFKDSSPFKGLIKERKVKVKKPHVQGETLAIKIKDMIHEVITAAGNPVSFLLCPRKSYCTQGYILLSLFLSINVNLV